MRLRSGSRIRCIIAAFVARAAVLAASVVFCAAAGYAQTSVPPVQGTAPTAPITPAQPAPAPPPAPKARGARISQYDLSEFPVVRLFVSVTDTRGLPIKNLLPEDFSITENGEPVDEVRFANPEVFDLPLAICFVIDVSGSMQGEVAHGVLRFGRPVGGEVEDVPSPLDLEVEAVKAFIRQLARDDRVALIKFADAVVTVEDFTDDKGIVTDALEHLRAFGQTRLYDAIRKGMALARHESGYRRAVIVLSDGLDNASTETPDTLMDFFRDEVLAKNESFSVFTLGLGDQIDVNGLTYVADGTGGMFFESPTPYDLKEIYQTILDQILNEYVLEYDSREMRQGAIVEGTVTAQTVGRTAETGFTFRSPGLGTALARMIWPGAILMAIAFIALVVLTISKLLRAAWVTVMVAPLEGKDYVLRGDNLLGRGEECTVQIRHDPGVSRQHARIELGGEGFTLTALDEANPPLYRGMPIRQARLQDGDDFIIGNTRVIFHERRVRPDAGEVDIEYLMEEADREERETRAEMGIPLETEPPGAPAASALVVTGPHSGMAFELKAELFIGRKEGIIVLPDDGRVSRRHACIRKTGDAVTVEDLGSTNGTELNGRKLAPHQPEAAYAGDIIALGDTQIKLL
ncbi:FHA domain-containing protein [bacterium]|nr:FHA domain-containing protein [bacterium]